VDYPEVMMWLSGETLFTDDRRKMKQFLDFVIFGAVSFAAGAVVLVVYRTIREAMSDG